jgi:hypothetical protein
MKNNTLKLSMIAAAISLSTLAAPMAQAGQMAGHISRDTGVGRMIAAQGNAALRLIRAELKAEWLAQKPALPASVHATKVAVVPAGGAGPASASARCAK